MRPSGVVESWVLQRRSADRSKDNRSVSGSYRARPPLRSWLRVRQVGVDLAGDVTLEDADDLAFGASLGQTSFDVDTGSLVGAHAGEHDPPEGVVRLPVAAEVEPVADGLAR